MPFHGAIRSRDVSSEPGSLECRNVERIVVGRLLFLLCI